MPNYRTNEMSIAGYLFSQGLHMTQVDTSTPRFTFVFNISHEQGMEIENNWWKGVLSVNPRVYFQGLEQVKDILHTARRRLASEPLTMVTKQIQ